MPAVEKMIEMEEAGGSGSGGAKEPEPEGELAWTSFDPYREADDGKGPESRATVCICLAILLIATGVVMTYHESLPFEDVSLTKVGRLLWVVGLLMTILTCVCMSMVPLPESSSNGKWTFRRMNDKFAKYKPRLHRLLDRTAKPLPTEAQKLLDHHWATNPDGAESDEDDASSRSAEEEQPSADGGQPAAGTGEPKQSKKAKKAAAKAAKKGRKEKAKSKDSQLTEMVRKEIEAGTPAKEIYNKLQPKVYVIIFEGDTAASQVADLRKQVSIVLTVASKYDEVVCVLTSFGGYAHSYALAGAQLARIRHAKIKLTVCVDYVAASGGYMMACVADKIVASPGAFVGSIGVVSYRPNFQKLVNKAEIDVYLLTSGKYKRTIDAFGDVTEEGKEKAQEELTNIHEAFKGHVVKYRPGLDIEAVSTGEAWMAIESMEKGLNLVDELMTSDEYIESRCKTHDVVKIKRAKKKGFEAIMDGFQASMRARLTGWAGGSNAPVAQAHAQDSILAV